MTGAPVEAVLFDLDDTLYPQAAWLDGAWPAVAAAARPYGVGPPAFERALRDVAAEGSDRGRIIDRALERVGAGGVPVAPLVDAFKAFRPAALALYPGVADALAGLREEVPIGLVTDGDVELQRAKLARLGLEGAFDAVVLSDTLGRARRKPHPAPFRLALATLGVAAHQAVFVGDRPDKDVRGARGAGLQAIRVRTGEYAARPNEPQAVPLADVPGVSDAVEAVRTLLPAGVPRRRR